MMKTALCFVLFGLLPILTGCVPTATITGTVYTPINYTYVHGYSPPQVRFPDPVADSDNYPQQKNDNNEMGTPLLPEAPQTLQQDQNTVPILLNSGIQL